jgi:hypothetical protein
MIFGQREKQVAVHHIVALVEFDMQKMRVRFFLTREAIKERMQELEHPQGIQAWIVSTQLAATIQNKRGGTYE